MCHFDSQVYEATGHVSGGVCDGCAHNTQGRNCEECIPYYYQDPERELYDQDICQRESCGLLAASSSGSFSGVCAYLSALKT